MEFFEKKKSEIFIAKMDRSWLVQKSKNVENIGNFGHLKKKKGKNRDFSIFLTSRNQNSFELI